MLSGQLSYYYIMMLLGQINVCVGPGDADAEVRRLMTESAELNSAQQEAEAHLKQSRQTIQELQAALKTAQVQALPAYTLLYFSAHHVPPAPPFCPS